MGSKPKELLLLILLLIGFKATAQISDSLRLKTYEIRITSDNDVYLLNSSDEYYTNGIRFDFQMALDEERGWARKIRKHLPKLDKIILGVRTGQNTYTPQNVNLRDVTRFNRPYAGWLYAGSTLRLFHPNNLIFTADMDVGVTGPWSGSEWLQKTWHATFHFDPPRHWEYQIKNKVNANAKVSMVKEWMINPSFDFTSETSLQAGSLFTNAQQGFTIRLGDINTINNSILANSKLDMKKSKTQSPVHKEAYLFFGASAERVFYNGLIDGHLLNGRRLNTGQSLPWVYHYRYGISFGGRRTDFTFAINHLSPELQRAANHDYGSISFAVRF